MTVSEHAIINIVRRAKQGDQSAFAELYDLFADRIYAYVRMRVSSSQTAEDILQDVFVKAWQGCRQLDLKGLKFSAWLYTIATNTIHDHYRKVYRRPQTTTLETAETMAAEGGDASRLTEQGFAADTIQSALEQLPPAYRSVIELRHFQEFSVEETAKILGKSGISVRVLHHRAVKKLEQLCKKLYGTGI